MIEELRRQGMSATRQDEYQIIYKDRMVGLQRLDLFVVEEITVENKVVKQLTALHKAQGISYIKTVGKETGLLLNFGGPAPEFSRLFFNPAKKPRAESRADMPPDPSADWLYPALVYQIVGGLYEVHNLLGAGYVHRIYCHACDHEMRLTGLDSKLQKRIQATYKDVVLGDIAFGHLLVEGQVMVFPVAVGSLRSIHLENLKRWMRLCNIRLGILANFDESASRSSSSEHEKPHTPSPSFAYFALVGLPLLILLLANPALPSDPSIPPILLSPSALLRLTSSKICANMQSRVTRPLYPRRTRVRRTTIELNRKTYSARPTGACYYRRDTARHPRVSCFWRVS